MPKRFKICDKIFCVACFLLPPAASSPMADIDDSRSEHSAFSDETGAGSAVTSSSLAEWQKKYSPNTSRKIDLGRKKVLPRAAVPHHL